MITAIIGVGNIGTIVARNLVQGGERVILANRDKSKAGKLAAELGDLATSAEVADAIAQSDVVVLALYLDVTRFFIPEFGEKLAGKIVSSTHQIPSDQTAKAASRGRSPLTSRPDRSSRTCCRTERSSLKRSERCPRNHSSVRHAESRSGPCCFTPPMTQARARRWRG